MLQWALRGVGVLLVVAVGACLAVGADRPANPTLLPNADRAGLAAHSSPTSRVAGFGQIGFRLETARATSHVGSLHCALLADKAAARTRGMQGRRDFAGYDGMVFRYLSDTTEPFSDQGVPVPLAVAWFDAAGVLVGTGTLLPCPAACARQAPVTAYRLALVVPAGGLRRLGVAPGSVLLVGGHCAT
jgi:uncharacterized membrane protein (UPF0127 family)